MKIFKQIDLTISVTLIIGFFIVSVIRRDATFLIGYFITGGWQVISMIVHAADGTFAGKGTSRYNYHWSTGVVIALSLLSLLLAKLEFVYSLLVIFPILVFIAPLMAIYYAWLCSDEIAALKKREFIHLK
jgi:hypothetical protein